MMGYPQLKPYLDASIAFLALIVLSPVLLAIAICIKVESAGPVFFIQERVGRGGKLFRIYKFRSMRKGTPNLATDLLDEPERYVTRIGRWIRRTSLDELPQLLNILKGEMSWVGPRPALYNQYDLIAAREALGIHRLTPGLTGYAQIMGRDLILDGEKVAYDKFYLDHFSFRMDAKIILMTCIKIVTAEGIRG